MALTAETAEEVENLLKRLKQQFGLGQNIVSQLRGIVMHWAAKFQPKPDESDGELFAKIMESVNLAFKYKVSVEESAKRCAELISSHTAAKVAVAEERGWNMGAAAERHSIAGLSILKHNQAEFIRSLPLPPYQKKDK